MLTDYPVRAVIDLTDKSLNRYFNSSHDQVIEFVKNNDEKNLNNIDGCFAVVSQQGHIVRMARSLQIPLRYFIAKLVDGPTLIVAHRMEDIASQLKKMELLDQFHPSYTRMVPAHYITEIALLGCPDPNPVYNRFFDPQRNALPEDIDGIGLQYMRALKAGIKSWLLSIPENEPVGVSYSGGIDSTSVLLMTYHLFSELNMNPGRLKAFTLSVENKGEDLGQARSILYDLDLTYLLEPITVSEDYLDLEKTVEIIEDYKPLDVQAGASMLALLMGIRERYPEFQYLLDGDGGDENLKDYPIEENPELTIKSVLNNLMLYHEGWGVDSIKHSLTYSGGLSRGCVRGFAPAQMLGFYTFSPYMLPSVIEVAEGIPFIDLTEWDHEKLYRLKGQIVSSGIYQVTGLHMPAYEKRRFQHGIGSDRLKEVESAEDNRKFSQQERKFRDVLIDHFL